jgi:hypothetical protein
MTIPACDADITPTAGEHQPGAFARLKSRESRVQSRAHSLDARLRGHDA